MKLVDTQREVGRHFKVTQSAVAVWNQRGMPRTADGKYDLDEIQKWRMKNLKPGNGSRTLEQTKKLEGRVAQLRLNTDMPIMKIAEAMNVEPATVKKITDRVDKYRPGLEHFKANKADYFTMEQMRYLDHITDDKLEKTAARDLRAMAKTAWEQERVERGESVDNVAVIVKHINALKEKEEDADPGRS